MNMNDLPQTNDSRLPVTLLPPFTTGSTARRRYDVVVVGAGVAGLAFTLRLPATWRVALLTKGALGESNTRYAQGGLAAAVGGDDSPALHAEDTLVAGAGLCDPAAVQRLVEAGPAAVDWLLAWGTRFDRAGEELLLGREAAHSRRRVLHAGGDATGAEIERALVAAVRDAPAVDVFERTFALDLLVADGRCAGVVAELAPGAGLTVLEAPVTVLANGGAGQLWATTSNPAGATADGLAMAIRAGVAIADVEFVQFHPTVLAVPGSAPFLVSEAVRGEGAYLRDAAGERFMLDVHPLAELAPRDVVARAIQRQMASDGADHVFLDLRHLDPDAMRARFPTIARKLAARGLDLATDLIPIAPAAHYFMGGIVTATDGATSLPGLLALGEASCTGVHGANRLASNSLLEGLVFGLDAADTLTRDGLPSQAIDRSIPNGRTRLPERLDPPLSALRSRLQRAMSRHVAVARDAAGLEQAREEINQIAAAIAAHSAADRDGWELQNMALAASAIITAAMLREESRGAHYRSDFPDSDPKLASRHLAFGGTKPGWRYATLLGARGAREPAIADR